MFKLTPIQSYFTIFYIFGLSPFISFRNPSAKHSLIVLFLPQIINICINLLIAYHFFDNGDTNEDFFLGHFLLIILIFSSLVAIIEKLCHLKFIPIILQVLCYIVNNLETSLQVEFSYNSIKKDFRCKFISLFVSIIATLIVRLTFESELGFTRTTDILMALSHCFKYLHMLHVTVYIDFIRLTFEIVGKKIEMMRNNKVKQPIQRNFDSLHVMRSIKVIHFKLWHISHWLNAFFGWFLVTFMIEASAFTIYAIYWIFLYGNRPDLTTINMLRKYFHFICILLLYLLFIFALQLCSCIRLIEILSLEATTKFGPK